MAVMRMKAAGEKAGKWEIWPGRAALPRRAWLFVLFVALSPLLLFPAHAAKTNFVHNGSFEIGASGWSDWGNTNQTSLGNFSAIAQMIVSTNGGATHGTHFIYSYARLMSEPFRILLPGTYTASAKVRANFAHNVSMNLLSTTDQATLPTPTFAITTSWQLISNTITVTSNDLMCVKFYSTALFFVDEVMVNTGAVALAFTTRTPIEVGMDTADYANNLFLSDAKILRFNFYNNGPQTNVTAPYEIKTIWNTNIASGDITTNALAANAGTTINLALPSYNGYLRITSYITNLNETMDETSVAIFPYDAQSGRDTNNLLGIHPHWSVYHLSDARRVGFGWARIFSPIPEFRWTNVFPRLIETNTYNGQWLIDYFATNIANGDLIPIVPLTGEDHKFYNEGVYDDTNASLAVMVGYYTNYVRRMVEHLSAAPFNFKHWGIWNEHQQTPHSVVALEDPQIYVNFLTNAARAIKIADPTAVVMGLSGVAPAELGSNDWFYATSQGKSDIDWLDLHYYPQQSGLEDPNATEDNASDTSKNYASWFNAFPKGTRNVINSETAVSGPGGYHTMKVAYRYPYYWDDPNRWTNESWYAETDSRIISTTDRLLYNFCRSIGWGMNQFNLQNARAPDEVTFTAGANGPAVTIYELNNMLKPWVVALLNAADLVKRPGLGRWTIASQYFIEAYGHTNSLGVVAPIFAFNRGGYTLTVTNGAFEQLDFMRNRIRTNSLTFNVGRSVTFLRSGTLTYAQMKATIENATVVTNADTTAPGLSIDVAPTGWTTAWGTSGSNDFKALALDDSVMTWASSGTSSNVQVQYCWSVDGGSNFSPWSPTNHFSYSWPVAGNYNVIWKAKDAAGNVSTKTTANFGDLSPPPNASTNGLTINVTGRLNVGTLILR